MQQKPESGGVVDSQRRGVRVVLHAGHVPRRPILNGPSRTRSRHARSTVHQSRAHDHFAVGKARSFMRDTSGALEWMQRRLPLPAFAAAATVVIALLLGLLGSATRGPHQQKPRVVAGRRISGLVSAAANVRDGRVREAAVAMDLSPGQVNPSRALGWLDAAVVEAGGNEALVSTESGLDVVQLRSALQARSV